jgi:hypothetical protein
VRSMGFELPFVNSPYPWICFAGLFFAAALNRALRSAAYPRWRTSDPERARTAKWIFFTLYLSLSVIAALGAVFVPGPEKIADIGVLYFFLGSSAFFYLLFRFSRTLGPVLIVLLTALVVTVLLFLQSLRAFTGETEIGLVRVLDVREGEMKLEIIPAEGESAITLMKGSYFAPVVKVVIFQDYFVFLGAKTWYRFEGLTSFEMEKTDSGRVLRQQDTDFYFDPAPGVAQKLWNLYERYDSRIPGVRTVQVEMDLKRARELSVYSLRVQNDGGLQILELQ